MNDLVEPAAFYTDLALSPDGQRIAFVRIIDSDDRGDIFIMNVDGSGLTRLIDTPSYDEDLQWSPDGQNIAFASTPDAEAHCAQICPFDLYVVNIASRKVNRLGMCQVL